MSNESKYFPDRHLMLTGFEHKVMDAILDLERRIDALEEREFKYSVLLMEEQT